MLLPLLKVGMTKSEIEELLGPPSSKRLDGRIWDYGLFYSQSIDILFDASGRVSQIDSSLRSSPTSQPTEYAVTPPRDLADALRQFREERPRVAAARMIEPLLKKGLDRKEVEELLGRPTKDRDIAWIYGLGKHEALSHYWIVYFEDSKLLSVESNLQREPASR